MNGVNGNERSSFYALSKALRVTGMANYTKLWSHILNSTIWSEDDQTRIVWITMLALSDMGGYVAGSIPGLAHQARVPLPSCEKALITLKSPDMYSRTKDHEGRRVEEVEGGWMILNYEKHRLAAEEEIRRTQNRERARRFRAKDRNDTGVTDNAKITPRNALSRPSTSTSASASTPLHPSCATARSIMARAGMDDGGWRKIEEKIKTPVEAMLLVEASAGKKNPPGWIVDHVRSGYEPPPVVPQTSVRRWANDLGIIASIAGNPVTERIKVSNGHILIGSATVKNSELKPEAIEFREAGAM